MRVSQKPLYNFVSSFYFLWFFKIFEPQSITKETKRDTKKKFMLLSGLWIFETPSHNNFSFAGKKITQACYICSNRNDTTVKRESGDTVFDRHSGAAPAAVIFETVIRNATARK
jgi:hypothetical protein